MRISDWSSDVCSSDLRETELLRPVADAFAAALRERAIDSVADIGKFTPSLNFDQAAAASGSSNSVTVFLRGIGQTDFNLTVDPGVGIYVDGVYISRSVGALLETRDVENIQVLRGPQGNIFGKNTIRGDDNNK